MPYSRAREGWSGKGGDVFLGLMYPSALLLPQTHLVWFRLHPEINVTHPDARESDKGGDNASPTVRCLGNSIGKQCSMVRRSGWSERGKLGDGAYWGGC